MKNSRPCWLLLLLFSLLPVSVLQAQYTYILDHPTAEKRVHDALDHLYNRRFSQSMEEIRALDRQMPGHPAVSLLKAWHVHWSDYPSSKSTENFNRFKGHLSTTLSRANAALDNDPRNPEANYFALLSHGLLVLFYAEESRYMKSISHAKDAYSSIKRGFEYKEEYPDFYLPCGLYEYFRELYPDLNPVIKPFMGVFRSGSKQKGLEYLEKASALALFTKPESYNYRTYLLLHFENDYPAALRVARQMADNYENVYFRLLYAEALMVNSELRQMKKIADPYTDHENEFYQANAEILKGYYLEKGLGNTSYARIMYQQGLEHAESSAPEQMNNLMAVAHAGLARIYDKQGKTNLARNHYEEVLEQSETFEFVVPEAQRYLNNH